MKVENYQGTFYDDSALNGIRLKCSNGQELSSREGPDGQWSSWTSSSHGLTAADMRSEPRDSWAAAAIMFRVRSVLLKVSLHHRYLSFRIAKGAR